MLKSGNFALSSTPSHDGITGTQINDSVNDYNTGKIYGITGPRVCATDCRTVILQTQGTRECQAFCLRYLLDTTKEGRVQTKQGRERLEIGGAELPGICGEQSWREVSWSEKGLQRTALGPFEYLAEHEAVSAKVNLL